MVNDTVKIEGIEFYLADVMGNVAHQQKGRLKQLRKRQKEAIVRKMANRGFIWWQIMGFFSRDIPTKKRWRKEIPGILGWDLKV